MENLLGDALISASYICMLPPFNRESRYIGSLPLSSKYLYIYVMRTYTYYIRRSYAMYAVFQGNLEKFHRRTDERRWNSMLGDKEDCEIYG